MDAWDLSEFISKEKCDWCGREGQVLMTSFDGKRVCRIPEDKLRYSECWKRGIRYAHFTINH